MQVLRFLALVALARAMPLVRTDEEVTQLITGRRLDTVIEYTLRSDK